MRHLQACSATSGLSLCFVRALSMSSFTMSSDEAVRSTDDDAASMRQSAVDKGYLDDAFAPIFYSSPTHGGPSRPPLINIGTHHRSYAIDLLVDRFFAACGEGGGQVVSLGAGSDTRFFRYMDRPHPPRIRKYIELDLPASTTAKIKHITSSPRRLPFLTTRTATPNIKLHPVSASLEPESPDSPKPKDEPPTTLISPIYTLLPMDLREATPETLEKDLMQYLDPKIPTLFLAECVLCYLSPSIGSSLIKWFGERFERSCGIIYEMLGTKDAFGQVMRRNLAARGLDIPGAAPFPDVSSESKRFVDQSHGGGFSSAGAKSLWEIRKSVIEQDELQRVSKLEMLDEIEELKLVLSHYMIAWGSKGEGMDAVRL